MTDERERLRPLAEWLRRYWMSAKGQDVPDITLPLVSAFFDDAAEVAALLSDRTGERERLSEDGIFRRGYQIGYADGRAENPEDADWHLAIEGPAPEPERGDEDPHDSASPDTDPERGLANCGGCDWTYAGERPRRAAMAHLHEAGHAVGWYPEKKMSPTLHYPPPSIEGGSTAPGWMQERVKRAASSVAEPARGERRAMDAGYAVGLQHGREEVERGEGALWTNNQWMDWLTERLLAFADNARSLTDRSRLQPEAVGAARHILSMMRNDAPRAASPEPAGREPGCPGCAEGDAPVLLDEHGTLTSISGLPGRLGHGVDDCWWYCEDYNPGGAREALRPFAAMAASCEGMPDDFVMSNTRTHPPITVGDFRRAASVLAGAPAPAGEDWQPIETAPKDEWTKILAYFGSDRYGVLHWSGWGGGTWRCAFTGHNVHSEPTHWMPLPAAPQDATGEEVGNG